MSGGSMDYIGYQVKEHIGCFDDDKLNDLLNDMADLLHDREWYLSGDTGEGSWNLSKKAFAEKWFGEKDEKSYCRDCFHFSEPEKETSHYGRCAYKNTCLTHEYDSPCERFERWGL